jgi:predicted adenylyl cyclase CyaB
MPRNIEIKARITGRREDVESRAAKLADSGPTILHQEDIFYTVPHGRLKLRTENRRSELICYLRSDQSGPKESNYIVLPVPDPQAAQKILTQIHGLRAAVRKQRTLYIAGQTRIHLDRVEGLGDFLELEVVLREAQSTTEGETIARQIMAKLGITAEHLVDQAYVDLLAKEA